MTCKCGMQFCYVCGGNYPNCDCRKGKNPLLRGLFPSVRPLVGPLAGSVPESPLSNPQGAFMLGRNRPARRRQNPVQQSLFGGDSSNEY